MHEQLQEALIDRLHALTRRVKTPLGVARRLQKAGCFGPRQSSMCCPLQRWLVTGPEIQQLLPSGGSITVGAHSVYAFFKEDDKITHVAVPLDDLLFGFRVEFDVNRKFDFLIP